MYTNNNLNKAYLKWLFNGDKCNRQYHNQGLTIYISGNECPV